MRFSKTHIIALVNQKGGCGKTSSAISIGAALAQLGYRVCLVDTDPQCNTTGTFGLDSDKLAEEGRFTLADVFVARRPAVDAVLNFGNRFHGRLSLIAGHPGLTSVFPALDNPIVAHLARGELSEPEAVDARHKNLGLLRKGLQSLVGEFDAVVIDTPPDLGFLMTSALIAANWFIIPLFPSGYDLDGLQKLTKTAEKIRADLNPELRLAGVLLGNYDRTALLDSQIHQLLTAKFGAQLVFRTTIGRTVRFRECSLYHQTIFEHTEASIPAGQYLDLVKEMLSRASEGASIMPLPEPNALTRVANG